MTDIEVTQKLNLLKNTFAHGKFWNHDPNDLASAEDINTGINHPDSVRDIPCTHHPDDNCNYYLKGACGCNCFKSSIQCAGFALYMAYRVFNSYPQDYYYGADYNGYTDANGWIYYTQNHAVGIHLSPGDIIRKNGHSAIVHTVTTDSTTGKNIVTFAEVWGNPQNVSKRCMISWGGYNGSITNEETLISTTSEYIIKAPKSSSGGNVPIKYTVKFYRNYSVSDTEQLDTKELEAGKSYRDNGVTFYIPPDREDFVFAGWYTDREGGTQHTLDTIVPAINYPLYAQWILVVNITYYRNYSDKDTTCKVVQHYANQKYGNSLLNPSDLEWTRSNYEFDGWYTDRVGGTQHTADSTIKTYGHPLYARWKHKVNVIFVRNRTAEDVINFNTTTCYEGQPIGDMSKFEYIDFETEDAYYTFEGWYTSRSGGTKYTSETIVPNEDTLYLYAHWTRVAAVTYIKNSSTSDDEEPITLKFPVGGEISLLPAGCDGYRFDGWYTAVVGGTRYFNGTIVPAVKNLTLYGHWTRIVQVTLKRNFSDSDTSTFNTFNAYDGEAYGEALPSSMERSGYRFDGWFTEQSGGNQVTTETLCSNSDHSLYAHWTKVTAVIFCDNYSGNAITVYCPTNEKYGSVLNDNIPIRDGCTFKGWYTSSDSEGYSVKALSIVPENTVVLYAHWMVRVLFNPCGGCLIGNSLIYCDVGEIFGRLPEVCCCEEEKYFDGWYTLPNGKGQKINILTIVPDYNMVLYANWRPEL